MSYYTFAKPMIAYDAESLQVKNKLFININLSSIGSVQRQFKIYHIIQTSQVVFRWLPVGHNWYKCNLALDPCPGCGQP